MDVSKRGIMVSKRNHLLNRPDSQERDRECIRIILHDIIRCVLFLDELPEFSRDALEVPRQPSKRRRGPSPIWRGAWTSACLMWRMRSSIVSAYALKEVVANDFLRFPAMVVIALIQ